MQDALGNNEALDALCGTVSEYNAAGFTGRIALHVGEQFAGPKCIIGDSFFIKEVPIEEDPFRKYVGICAPGQSVKTALLRTYSIILQSAHNYALQEEYKDVIDPYYSLVGYFNSIRELGGAVRLLQDDIPKRIYRIKNKYDFEYDLTPSKTGDGFIISVRFCR